MGTCRERWPSASCDELAEVTTCAGFGGDCTSSGCCATAGQHCFMKDRYLSRCMHACVPTDELRGWSYAYAGELEHSRLTLESSNTLDSHSRARTLSTHTRELEHSRLILDNDDMMTSSVPHTTLLALTSLRRSSPHT